MTRVLHRIITPHANVPPRPTMLSIAFWAYIGTAVANIVLTVLADVLIAVALGHLGNQRQSPPHGSVIALVAVTAVVALGYSLVLVLLALRLRAGSSRARPALLTASLLSLFLIVTQGPALLVIPLLVVSGVIVTRRPITLWLRACRGLSPA